ncbi:winged helix-turn-helix domain-containing protein [Micromonospora sp. NPDC023633]|uniref:ArsR/SmtB family transcription factor n=1 Tax=Micromonospora sp. NPDC023633 TaxID=3154320 RepID=UPI00340F7E64
MSRVPELAPVRWWQAQRTNPWPAHFCPAAPPARAGLPKELNTVRSGSLPGLTDWLARIMPRGTVPERMAHPAEDPAEMLSWLADGFAAYWEAVLAPYWSRMQLLLDDEVLYRAQTLATEGPTALLTSVYVPGRIRTLRRHAAVPHMDGGVIYVMPLVFRTDGPLRITDEAGNVVVIYQARGVASLMERAGAARGTSGGVCSPGARLGILVGQGRSLILRALAAPGTTAGLAKQLRLAPSTVSEHLTALTNAGVVHRRRAGRHVLYELSPAGAALVGMLDESMDPLTV